MVDNPLNTIFQLASLVKGFKCLFQANVKVFQRVLGCGCFVVVFALELVAWMKIYCLPTFGPGSCLDIENSKSHVEWSEAKSSIIVNADTIHVENDGYQNFV